MTTFQFLSLQAQDRAASLEGRLALRIAACLDESTNGLPHGVAERLRVGREQALIRARASRQAALASRPVWAQVTSVLALGGPSGRGWHIASLLPLLTLLAGLFAIHQFHDREQIYLAAEIDAAILADELPPAAYRDPGFAVFLQSQDAR